MRNESRFGLKQKEQVAVFLRLFVVREAALFKFCRIRKTAFDFVLLLHHVVRFLCVFREALVTMFLLSSQLFFVTYLFKRHSILDQQRYPRIQISDIFLQGEILLRLRRNLRLKIAKNLLSYISHQSQQTLDRQLSHSRKIPFAKSSSISSSFSFACKPDRYRAVTEYRFDWRADRVPS